MSAPNPTLYAVGLGRWVEVRESSSPLKAVTTNLKVKKGSRKVLLPHTVVPGGTPVKTFLAATFYNRVGMTLALNQIITLTSPQVKALKLAPPN